jgi:hypothetical protein
MNKKERCNIIVGILEKYEECLSDGYIHYCYSYYSPGEISSENREKKCDALLMIIAEEILENLKD